MPQKSKFGEIEYNGEMLTIRAISKKEGVSTTTLTRKYEQTQDIYEAVKLAKKSKESSQIILYYGEELTIAAIAKRENVEAHTLKDRYEKTNDIYEAVKLAKEVNKATKYIIYKGKKKSISAIAKEAGVYQQRLKKYFDITHDIEKAIEFASGAKKYKDGNIKYITYYNEELTLPAIAEKEGIASTTLANKYEKTNDIYEAVKLAKEAKVTENERKTYIQYGDELLTIYAIAKKEGLTESTLRDAYNDVHDIQKAIEMTREARKKWDNADRELVLYNGEKLSIRAIAKKEGIAAMTLRSKYQKSKDICKAVMLCKLIKSRKERRTEIVQTKKFGNLTYYDLSLIIGIKYSELEKLLEQGNSIDDIIDSKEDTTRNSSTRENIKLENGQSLTEYCIENKLNYSCIYWAMKTYGKTLEEAVASYNKNGQATPKTWIYEKYGLLFKHLMLKESIDINRVVSYMRKEYLPMQQAVERYIIRSNAKKYDLDNDWMEELYDVLSDDSLSKEDYDGYVKNFYVDDQEEKCIKESKEKINTVKRKLLLFELSDVIREGIFTPEEEKRLFEEYNITEEEVDVIFNDLYDRFTDPGVLMGKDQQEIISPEVEKKRKEQISKYKQMVRDIKQDNEIVVMMRFMVGPNIESNEECRTELHKELQKELQKENKQVDVGQ